MNIFFESTPETDNCSKVEDADNLDMPNWICINNFFKWKSVGYWLIRKNIEVTQTYSKNNSFIYHIVIIMVMFYFIITVFDS